MTKTVLVIDDDPAVRDAYELALHGLPYNVVSVANGEDGLAVIQQQTVDLVYLDLKMPGINGIETLRRLRAMDRSVPVYLVTGFAQDSTSLLRAAEREGLEFELVCKPLERSYIRDVSAALSAGAKLMAEDVNQHKTDGSATFIFHLYVVGQSTNSRRAYENLKAICESTFPNEYEIELVNVLENPQMAERERILATPTVIRHAPKPVRRIIGDLSDKDQVLVGLDLHQLSGSQI